MIKTAHRIFLSVALFCIGVIGVAVVLIYTHSVSTAQKNDTKSGIEAVDNIVSQSEKNPEEATVNMNTSAEMIVEQVDDSAEQQESSAPVTAIVNINTTAQTPEIVNVTFPHEEVKMVSVTLRAVPVGKSAEEYAVKVAKGSSVYEVMVAAEGNGFAFTSKSFPGIGRYVKSVLGIPEDKRAGFYWVYYINGKYASLGVSDTTVAQGDVIMWKFEKK